MVLMRYGCGLSLLFISLACCSNHPNELQRDPAMAELVLVQNADPRVALESAWHRGDKRFIAIQTFSTEIPGAEEFYDTLVREHGMRVLTGTGDAGVDDARAKLIAGARDYAERYNRLLLERLSGGGSSATN